MTSLLRALSDHSTAVNDAASFIFSHVGILELSHSGVIINASGAYASMVGKAPFALKRWEEIQQEIKSTGFWFGSFTVMESSDLGSTFTGTIAYEDTSSITPTYVCIESLVEQQILENTENFPVFSNTAVVQLDFHIPDMAAFVFPDDYKFYASSIHHCYRERKPYYIEFRRKHSSEKRYEWAGEAGIPLITQKGILTGFLKIQNLCSQQYISTRILDRYADITTIMSRIQKCYVRKFDTKDVLDNAVMELGVKIPSEMILLTEVTEKEYPIRTMRSPLWSNLTQSQSRGMLEEGRNSVLVNHESLLIESFSVQELSSDEIEIVLEDAGLLPTSVHQCLLFHLRLDEKRVGAVFFINPMVVLRKEEIRLLSPLFSTCAHVLKGLEIRRSQEEEMEEVEHYAYELERSNDELEAFAYRAAHDLRAPLRTIRTLVEMIQEDPANSLSDESTEDMRLIKERAKRLELTLFGLLQYAQVGSVVEASEYHNTRGLLEELISLEVSQSNFTIDLSGEFPNLYLPRAAFERVFKNLLLNSITHHDKEKGLIEVRSLGFEEGLALFEVEDDGPGILPKLHERVFEVFERGCSEEQGSGIGLAIVKKTICHLGGMVAVESDGVRGTCFTIGFKVMKK